MIIQEVTIEGVDCNNMLDELDHGHNKLEYIFKSTKKINHVNHSHYKFNFISEPWWTPKKTLHLSYQLQLKKWTKRTESEMYFSS